MTTNTEEEMSQKKLWCFTCDEDQSDDQSGKCPRCGSELKEVEVAPRFVLERLIWIGIVAAPLVLWIVLEYGLRLQRPDMQTLPGKIIGIVEIISMLIVGAYFTVFIGGGYIGLPHGLALFKELRPITYPEGQQRKRFSKRRLGQEILVTIFIMGAALVIAIIFNGISWLANRFR